MFSLLSARAEDGFIAVVEGLLRVSDGTVFHVEHTLCTLPR